jgi:UDP-N-acetylmuramate--alanine ligase
VNFHVVGIGGAGMSAIARLLLAEGHHVSGSDRGEWPLAQALARDGATVHTSFAAEHVDGAEVVLRSSAYGDANPEVRAAQGRGIPVWKREDGWRFLAQGKRVAAIAGTHGKTTTTAMTWAALRGGGVDASLICGAPLLETGSNAHRGASNVLVIEADEYDNAFLALEPDVAVVTNVDWDHVDFFPDRATYQRAFSAFVAKIPDGGLLVLCSDDVGSQGLSDEAAKRGIAIEWYDAAGSPRLLLPGTHNALNAAGALRAALALGADRSGAIGALERFRGTARRLEKLGAAKGIDVLDDYAHHPREIRASIDAMRAGHSRVVAVFQPHTPSRLRAFHKEFVDAFREPAGWIPTVIVETFSSAREDRDEDRLAESLAEEIRGTYAPDAESAARKIVRLAQPGDAVLVMGAGDTRPIAERVLELLHEGAPA